MFDNNGEMTSFVLLESGREFAAGPMNRLLLYKDVPRVFDAWDIDSNYEQQPRERPLHRHSGGGGEPLPLCH